VLKNFLNGAKMTVFELFRRKWVVSIKYKLIAAKNEIKPKMCSIAQFLIHTKCIKIKIKKCLFLTNTTQKPFLA